jgi:hypothetical protein
MGLSMERIELLDEIHTRESEEFRKLEADYAYPSPLFLQNRNLAVTDFPAMAKKWIGPSKETVSAQEIRLFTELQILLYSAAGGSEDAPDPNDAARLLGIPDNEFDQFQDYFFNAITRIGEEILFAVEEHDGIPPEKWEPGELQETHNKKIAESHESVS